MPCRERPVGRNVGASAQQRCGSYTKSALRNDRRLPARPVHELDPPPEIVDGQTFRTADGRAELSIYGTRNSLGDTPQSYVDNYVDAKGVVLSLKRVTERFFVVSGTKDAEIFYQRCNFPAVRDGIVDCLSITYPAQDKATRDPIVTRLSRSLRAGRGFERRR